MRKIGFIGRADNSGLGTMSWEFTRHIPCEKILIVKNGVYQIFPERFPGAKISGREFTKETVDWLLDGITGLVAFETTYDMRIFKEAKKRKIKTYIIPMYECSPPMSIIDPDVIICPSELDFNVYSKNKAGREVVFIPFPVDRERLKFTQKTKAHTFVHNAGHGGLAQRNGTSELLAAIPMVQSDVKFIIRSQGHINYSHPKADVRVGNFENYWDLWNEGDVFVFPHKFDGMSLPVQEALAVGMPVLSTAIFPFTKWLPTDWFFTADQIINTRVMNNSPEIEYAVVKPEEIARKIDEIANQDIREMSNLAMKIADKISWDKLKAKYVQVFSQ